MSPMHCANQRLMHAATSTGTVQLDAHTAIMTLLEFLYISFPFGIATSATIRVGNLLGAGRPKEARIAGKRAQCAPRLLE